MRFRMHPNILANGIFALGCALALTLSACGSSSQPGGGQATGSQALHITLDADRAVIAQPEDLCNPPVTAEVIASAHGVARWNTADGKRPAIATVQEAMQKNYYIYRTVAFSQMTALHDTHKAAAGSPSVYITLGGQVGQDSYSIDDMPQLEQANGHYIIMLAPPTSTTNLPAGDVLLVSYAFPVDAQGVVTLRQAGNPNEPGVGPVDPGLTITLASLKQVLASCKA